MDTSENEALVRRYFEEVWGRGNVDAIDDLLAEGYVDHDAPPGFPKDREAQKQVVAYMAGSAEDKVLTIHEVVSQGDLVAVRHQSEWTQRGDFFGFPGDGKRLTLKGIDFYRVHDGRIVESWHVEDMLGLMMQMGVSPTSPPPS